MKPIEFVGDALARLRDFPDGARGQAGYQLDRVQNGLEPDEWTPMASIGSGVSEIRVCDADAGAYRVLYVASLADRILVLHAFLKTTQHTPLKDTALAAARLRQVMARRV